MEIKTFEGASMNEVVQSVRASFGKDAVILKTEEAKESGRRLFRVTATKDPAISQPKEKGKGSGQVSEALLELFQAIKDLDKKLDRVTKPLATRDQILTLDGRLDDVRKMVFSKLIDSSENKFDSKSESVRNLLHYLHLMELDGGLIGKLGAYLDSLPPPSMEHEDTDNYYKSYAVRWMMKRLQIIPILEDQLDVRVLIFVGGSGCGKSSTVLKVASQIKAHGDRSPIVVSLNTNQIAGSEKVRVLCKILGVEHVSFSTAQELKDYETKLPDNKILLIDTPSFNPKKEEESQFLAEFSTLKSLDRAAFHLVLSLAEKSSRMDKLVKTFSKIGITGLAFTKMDEVWNYGDIFNLSYKWGLPLTVFGISDEVPSGIEKASRERVVERIFGLRS